MKRVVLFIALCFSLTAVSFAQSNQTSAQKKLQNDIVNFLKEKGFSHSIDDNDDVVFKSEGKTHWISISSDSPFHIAIFKMGSSLEGNNGLNRNIAIKTCNVLNADLPAIRAIFSDTSVWFYFALIISSAEDFRYVFEKSLEMISKTEPTFRKYYNYFKN